jgi:hypothetical protein
MASKPIPSIGNHQSNQFQFQSISFRPMCDGGRPEAPMPNAATGEQFGAADEAGGGATPRPRGWKAVMFIIGACLDQTLNFDRV